MVVIGPGLIVTAVVVGLVVWGWRWFTTGACPRCRATVHRKAEMCPYCGADFT